MTMTQLITSSKIILIVILTHSMLVMPQFYDGLITKVKSKVIILEESLLQSQNYKNNFPLSANKVPINNIKLSSIHEEKQLTDFSSQVSVKSSVVLSSKHALYSDILLIRNTYQAPDGVVRLIIFNPMLETIKENLFGLGSTTLCKELNTSQVPSPSAYICNSVYCCYEKLGKVEQSAKYDLPVIKLCSRPIRIWYNTIKKIPVCQIHSPNKEILLCSKYDLNASENIQNRTILRLLEERELPYVYEDLCKILVHRESAKGGNFYHNAILNENQLITTRRRLEYNISPKRRLLRIKRGFTAESLSSYRNSRAFRLKRFWRKRRSRHTRSRRKAQTKNVSVLLGKRAFIPCQVTPRHDADQPQMLMWLKEDEHTPLFSIDFRETTKGRPQIWRDTASSLAQRVGIYMKTGLKDELKNENRGKIYGNSENINDLEYKHSFRSRSNIVGIEVSNVKFSDNGIYRCRVDYIHSPTRNAKVNLTVIVPPKYVEVFTNRSSKWQKLKSSQLTSIKLGSSITLKCVSSLAWPASRIIWARDSTVINSTWDVTGAKLRKLSHKSLRLLPHDHTSDSSTKRLSNSVSYITLDHLTRHDHLKSITCSARNINETNTLKKMITINLILPVLTVKMDPIQSVRAGESAEIQCTAWGSNPPPSFQWFLGGILRKTSQLWVSEDGNSSVSILTINPTSEDDSSTVSCSATNTKTGQDPSIGITETTTLSVLFRPQVKSWLGRSLNGSKIKEGDDVYFDCEVKSNPRPAKVQWLHQGKRLIEKTGILVSNMTLVLQKVKRSQAGGYTCQAINSIGITTSNSINLDIKFAPVCVSGEARAYSVAKEENARITCAIFANPANVSFKWTFNNTAEVVGVPSNRYVINGLQSVVNYTPMTELDYGTLLCRADNAIGSQAVPCIFQIVAAGKPEPPHNCRLKDVSLSFVEITCLPGNNGGDPQSFLIQAIEFNTGDSIIAEAVRQQPDFTVTNLKPGTPYRMVIVASNKRGHSRPIYLTATTTTQPSSRHETSAEPARGRDTTHEITMGVTVGAILICALISVTIVAFVTYACVKNRRFSFQRRIPIREDVMDEEKDILSYTQKERERETLLETHGKSDDYITSLEEVKNNKPSALPKDSSDTYLRASTVPPPAEYNQGYTSGVDFLQSQCICPKTADSFYIRPVNDFIDSGLKSDSTSLRNLKINKLASVSNSYDNDCFPSENDISIRGIVKYQTMLPHAKHNELSESCKNLLGPTDPRRPCSGVSVLHIEKHSEMNTVNVANPLFMISNRRYQNSKSLQNNSESSV